MPFWKLIVTFYLFVGRIIVFIRFLDKQSILSSLYMFLDFYFFCIYSTFYLYFLTIFSYNQPNITKILVMYSVSINPKPKILKTFKNIIVASPNAIPPSITKALPELSNPPSHRHLENQQLPAQHRTFKIRTFSSKLNYTKLNKVQIKQMEKELINNEAAEMIQGVKVRNNGSIQRAYLSSKTINHGLNFKPSSKNKMKENNSSSIFDAISIHNIEQSHLHSQLLNLSKISILSHKPHIIYNHQLTNHETKAIVFIISMKTLNYQPTKYFKDSNRHSSKNPRKSMEESDSVYPLETQNLLKSISNSSNKLNFFTHCKIFYKVNSSFEQSTLKDYLQSNHLNNYEGIIDVSNKHSEQYNIYNLKGLASDQDIFMILQEEDVLRHEFPLLEGDNTIIFANGAKGTNNSFMINQIINHIKDIEVKEELEVSPHRLNKRKVKLEEDKQNINPNIMYSTLKEAKSTAKKSKISLIRTIRKKQKKELTITAKITKSKLSFDEKTLFQKLTQAKNIKQVKSCLRQTRNNSINNVDQKITHNTKHKRNRSFDRSRKINKGAKVESNNHFNLQGSFKEKMIKYAKILENQMNQKMKNHKVHGRQRSVQKMDKNGDLDDLTYCLTSKLKTKTPFQLVGDLLRGNSHIAKQINGYLAQTKPIESQCDQYEHIFKQKRQTFQPFLSKIFYYKFQ